MRGNRMRLSDQIIQILPASSCEMHLTIEIVQWIGYRRCCSSHVRVTSSLMSNTPCLHYPL